MFLCFYNSIFIYTHLTVTKLTTKGIEPFKSNYNGNNKLFIKDLIKAREKAMEGKKITN